MSDDFGLQKFIIITGVSGAGKSIALKSFEDLGYFCVDNMPSKLLPQFADIALQSKGVYEKVVLLFDIREPSFVENLYPALDKLKKRGIEYEILFLEFVQHRARSTVYCLSGRENAPCTSTHFSR